MPRFKIGEFAELGMNTREDVWMRAWEKVYGDGRLSQEQKRRVPLEADQCLKEFDKRFPTEKGEENG